MKTAKEVLLTAADIVEKGWTQGVFATNAFGKGVPVESPEACSFCVLGALDKAAETGIGEMAWREAEKALFRTVRSPSLPAWNDAPERTQAEVVAALREAASKC